MSIAAWNVAGLQSEERARFVAQILDTNPVQDVVVGLIETRWKTGGERLLKSRNYKVAVSTPAVGKSGGLAVCVKMGVKVRNCGAMGYRCVVCEVKVQGVWVRVVLVYGGQSSAVNRRLTEDVEAAVQRSTCETVVIGDANKFRWAAVGYEDVYITAGCGPADTWRRVVKGVVRTSRPDRAWCESKEWALVHESFAKWQVGGEIKDIYSTYSTW